MCQKCLAIHPINGKCTFWSIAHLQDKPVWRRIWQRLRRAYATGNGRNHLSEKYRAHYCYWDSNHLPYKWITVAEARLRAGVTFK